ncbi:MAG: HAMP domain-containing histidine kinase [Deltaproteobacteria bacterium]|nr:HAMP domain-containing histidine kinase [Deltaproteobacteria bacterium]
MILLLVMRLLLVEDDEKIASFVLKGLKEAGAGGLECEGLDLAGLLRDACALFDPIAEEKGVGIVLEVPKECAFQGDIRKLQRMVANLLDNALKYTPSGGTVRISLEDGAGRIVLSVQDTGIGITPEDLPRIFDRFYRCDESRSQGGVGLGLSFALAVARAHGGNIRVQSTPGRGSTFSVFLPRSNCSQ